MAGGFGADAQRYHRARPDYPAALIDAITSSAPGQARALLDAAPC